MKLIPTILCGGSGSRLWPVSREQHPKPFIRLQDNQSLLQKAFIRGSELDNVAELLTVTNRDLFFKTQDEYRSVNAGKLPLSYILEPFGRNTAPAVAAAAIRVANTHGPDAILLMLAADHLIADQVEFANAVKRATTLAASGKIVAFGIQPTAPETGYGYIEAHGNDVLNFVEKPSVEIAIEYVASGRFLWNSGMFCFTAGTMLSEMAKHCPEVIESVKRCLLSSTEVVGEGFYKSAIKQRDSGGTSPELGGKLCAYLASAAGDGITGRLISAQWDPWERMESFKEEMQATDVYTLRRIVPAERGKTWEDG